jgi:hypothetical protein
MNRQAIFLNHIGSDLNPNSLPSLPAKTAQPSTATAGNGQTDEREQQSAPYDVPVPSGRTGLDLAKEGVPLDVLYKASKELEAWERQSDYLIAKSRGEAK